uniref:Uncharacterized protein n=1 Tax=Physcomitrium patens TaxID=3218 RepID=A0A2K1L295_PHYPA|nr:hypothetical protein PHYPA_002936 [Physcomitrium patens]
MVAVSLHASVRKKQAHSRHNGRHCSDFRVPRVGFIAKQGLRNPKTQRKDSSTLGRPLTLTLPNSER